MSSFPSRTLTLRITLLVQLKSKNNPSVMICAPFQIIMEQWNVDITPHFAKITKQNGKDGDGFCLMFSTKIFLSLSAGINLMIIM